MLFSAGFGIACILFGSDGKNKFYFFFVFLKNKQKKSQDDDQLILGWATAYHSVTA